MTNEELVRQYYDGDETALEKLYHKNLGLIRGIAKEAAAEFNCLTADSHHPNQFSYSVQFLMSSLFQIMIGRFTVDGVNHHLTGDRKSVV